MEKFVVNGGNRLCGSVQIESAKNSVLPILAASILTDETVVIEKCPKIGDVISMIEILSALGVKAEFAGENLIVDSSNIIGCEIPDFLAGKLRSSVFMMGALLSRFKRVSVALPGGCDIGSRPIDLHLQGVKCLGVSVLEEQEQIKCIADRIIGNIVRLDYPSVGATENLMLAAVFAHGKTEIKNAAKEPEVVDLMRFLNSMGAKVYGAGTSTILVEGVKKLHGTTFKPVSDRIETGTFMFAGAITGGELEIKGVNTKNISSIIHKFCDYTCKITVKNDIIYLKSSGTNKAFDLSTGPYPFFPTDLQAQAAVLLSIADGVSTVTENVFEKRFGYVEELIKMGADISVKGRSATIKGVKKLKGTTLQAKDLRGGAALVLAALSAEGVSEIYGVNHVARGYLNFDKKLKALGADIKLL